MTLQTLKSWLKKFFLGPGVRLYGTKEEYESALGKKYSEKNYPIFNSSDFAWWKAANLTKKIVDKKFKPHELLIKPNLKNFRVIGAGIQNAAPTEELVMFVRNSLAREGVSLVTYFMMPEQRQNYIAGMRCSLQDDDYHFGTSGKIRFNLPGKIIDRGVLMNKNMTSTHCNVVNGIRSNGKFSVENKTYRRYLFFGASEVFGTGLRDDQTISTHFEAIQKDNSNVICMNLGMGGVNFIDVVNRVLKFKKYKSDTVFLAVPFTNSLAHADLIITLDENEMFDYSHPNDIGAQKVAITLLNHIQNDQSNGSVASVESESINFCTEFYNTHINACEALEFKTGALENDLAYFNGVRKNYVTDGMLVGSVAVNCNPITLGHEYLIDYARSKVDILFVLVIEEDTSAVSFDDRLKLVSEVCEEKPNIFVLRGGSFVCTEFIAPEYFIKDELQSEVVDFSMESFYFGQYIGPALGVQKIFLGDEPKCAITKQYNEHMEKTMSEYGIELEIIPRINTDSGDVISASNVRKVIRNGDFSQLYNYVPLKCIPHLSSPEFKLRDEKL
jgi:hypothetical protein